MLDSTRVLTPPDSHGCLRGGDHRGSPEVAIDAWPSLARGQGEDGSQEEPWTTQNHSSTE